MLVVDPIGFSTRAQPSASKSECFLKLEFKEFTDDY